MVKFTHECWMMATIAVNIPAVSVAADRGWDDLFARRSSNTSGILRAKQLVEEEEGEVQKGKACQVSSNSKIWQSLQICRPDVGSNRAPEP
ncbi:hypothetical protein ZHAS_00018251 [Anopheles sinensis]|uniref:Uncharacterized protein n=1 Tax=Anopheles sinensis TaxID=74873 RepID=A0A084WIZ2_ANOSI|nr:hypothetical protein ZHAS_00018251 [Anopheles sinensis]